MSTKAWWVMLLVVSPAWATKPEPAKPRLRTPEERAQILALRYAKSDDPKVTENCPTGETFSTSTVCK